MKALPRQWRNNGVNMDSDELEHIKNFFESQTTYEGRLDPDYVQSYKCKTYIDVLINELKKYIN